MEDSSDEKLLDSDKIFIKINIYFASELLYSRNSTDITKRLFILLFNSASPYTRSLLIRSFVQAIHSLTENASTESGRGEVHASNSQMCVAPLVTSSSSLALH